MKKKILYTAVTILVFLITFIASFVVSTNIEAANVNKVRSQVYKNELSYSTSDKEIARILVRRMMKKYQFRSLNWYEWVWRYEIKKIDLPEGLPGPLSVVIYVKPLFPDAWRNIWTFEVDKVDSGWIRVGYLMSIDDYDDYLELSGPFSGG